MKHIFITLLIAIALFIVLILISEIVLPAAADDMVVNRMISGFIGMLSILLARFIVKKTIQKNDVQETR